RMVWSLLMSVICPSRTLMWLGTWTKGASAVVTAPSASPIERPSRATMRWKRSVVRGWSRSRMDSVSMSTALSAIVGLLFTRGVTPFPRVRTSGLACARLEQRPLRIDGRARAARPSRRSRFHLVFCHSPSRTATPCRAPSRWAWVRALASAARRLSLLDAALVARSGVVVPGIAVALVVQIDHVAARVAGVGRVAGVMRDGDDVVAVLVLENDAAGLIAWRAGIRDAVLVARVIAGALGRAAAQKNAGIVGRRAVAIDDRVARRAEQPDPVYVVVRGGCGHDRSVVGVIEPDAALLVVRGAEIEQAYPGAVPDDDARLAVEAGKEVAGGAVLRAID